ncbi:MAG: hypothetical protein ACFE8N_01765, partial [Promethearchaeota archaeon]
MMILPATPKHFNPNLDLKLNAPSITINNPTPYKLLNSTAPNYNVYIQDANDTYWYSIDGGITNITFLTNGTIDQNEWDGQGNGTVTIVFYANNTLAEETSASVTVRKDKLAPSITINSPTPNQLIGSSAPTFDLTIVEGNLNTTWYTIDGGSTNYTFTGTSGTINQGAWTARPNGTVTIRFYANDTFGNSSFNEVVVLKDTQAPSITINSPTPNQLIGNSAPTFELTIVEGNLNTTWYTIDGGSTNYTFTGTSGTINQGAWTARPNGTVTIRFYANDTFGNSNFDEVVVLKDTQAPSITINSPTPNQLFGASAPTFDLTITEGNLNTTWYTIDGGST